MACRILFCDIDLIYVELDINGIGSSVWYGKDDLGSYGKGFFPNHQFFYLGLDLAGSRFSESLDPWIQIKDSGSATLMMMVRVI